MQTTSRGPLCASPLSGASCCVHTDRASATCLPCIDNLYPASGRPVSTLDLSLRPQTVGPRASAQVPTLAFTSVLPFLAFPHQLSPLGAASAHCFSCQLASRALSWAPWLQWLRGVPPCPGCAMLVMGGVGVGRPARS